jgi:hypothetical protein
MRMSYSSKRALLLIVAVYRLDRPSTNARENQRSRSASVAA